MQDEMRPGARNLTTPYSPVAIYYEDADLVEYIRKDAPNVARRVDELLTLIYNMNNRDELIGFKLKGFKNYYLKNLSGLEDFVSVVTILENEMTKIGHQVIEREAARRDAYAKARDIADKDQVRVDDLPLRVGAAN